ncbi:MAG TPA: protein kinase, partial [Polyangiales bacterium]|nr:protein kinase [Polyangiales bacterium]
YLARTEGARGFSKPVVIKRILPIWGGDEEIVSLFAREARILSQLQDPGIVSVIDFGQIEDGTLVMVLDYVHGYHLAHWLSYLRAKQGNMPVEMALHIMIRVLSALQYAHSFVRPDGKPSAVIHRDVSPANILLDMSGNVKLVDFGIARAEGDANEYKTEAPQLRGKFGYLAPELFTGAPPSPQSDIYAAGVVLYEILTGDNPFRGREVTDSYHKALTLTPPTISSLRSDVTESLVQVIDGALTKEPAQRYATAAEFADALRRERSAPDEVCQARLRKAVQVAFVGPLAETLGIEPLSASDEVWRGVATDSSDATPPSVETAPGTPPGAAAVPSGSLQLAPLTASPGISLPPEGRESFPPSSDQPTMRRVDPGPTVPTPVMRPTHLRLVSLLSMVLFGAFLVAGMLRSFTRKEDQVIVIERESNQATAPAGSPAIAAAVADEEAPTDTVAEAQAAAPVKPNGGKPAQQTSVASAGPVEPDPALLTKRFAQEQSRVQRCFTTEAQQSDTQAELTLEFQVSTAGVVERAELPASVSAALRSCLLDVAKSTRFPRLTKAVTFRIPIQARVTQ